MTANTLSTKGPVRPENLNVIEIHNIDSEEEEDIFSDDKQVGIKLECCTKIEMNSLYLELEPVQFPKVRLNCPESKLNKRKSERRLVAKHSSRKMNHSISEPVKLIEVCSKMPKSASTRLQCPNSNSGPILLDKCEPKICISLNDKQLRALNKTWDKLMNTSITSGMGVVHLLERVHEMMFKRCPEMKTIFQQTSVINALRNKPVITVRCHAKTIVASMDTVISSITKNKGNHFLMKSQASYGECHSKLKKFGFKPTFFDIFGEALSDVIFMEPYVKSMPEAQKAWIIFISAITDNMKVSFERQVRKSIREEKTCT